MIQKNQSRGISKDSVEILKLIRNREFITIWFVGSSLSILRWLELLAVGVVVFDITESPIYVALMVILRFIPFIFLGFFTGLISERINRRLGLINILSIMALASLFFASMVLFGHLNLWIIGASIILNGLLWTLDFPIRITLFADIVQPDLLGKAITLDSVTNTITRFLGPLIGGFFLEFVGFEGVFFLGALLYVLAALAIIFGTKIAGENLRTNSESFISELVNGLHLLRNNRTLLGIMVVTVIFNLWGFPFFSMIPVFGKDVLGLSPLFLGLLVSAEGFGALIGVLLIVAYSRVSHYRKLYTYGTFLCLIMVFAFSQAPNFLSAAFFLFLTGIGGGCFSAMQSTLVMLCTPLEARGRMMGFLTLFIGLSTLGFFHIGLLANWLGTVFSMVVCSVEGFIMLLLACKIWPEILAQQSIPSDYKQQSIK